MGKAADTHINLVIIQMDTPGGLDRSIRDIIQMIPASPIPVVTYIAPAGAGSAATHIHYACHVAAMAPATNLRAATPISTGDLPGLPKPEEGENKKDKDDLPTNDTAPLKRKAIKDTSANIKALAERHGRIADWAVRAVDWAVSLSAEEAPQLQVIYFAATDLHHLLHQLDGQEIRLNSGEQRLSSRDMALIRIERS